MREREDRGWGGRIVQYLGEIGVFVNFEEGCKSAEAMNACECERESIYSFFF